ncbi:MAG: hypothetical protein Q9200_004536 [Gallowayella weberi]
MLYNLHLQSEPYIPKTETEKRALEEIEKWASEPVRGKRLQLPTNQPTRQYFHKNGSLRVRGGRDREPASGSLRVRLLGSDDSGDKRNRNIQAILKTFPGEGRRDIHQHSNAATEKSGETIWKCNNKPFPSLKLNPVIRQYVKDTPSSAQGLPHREEREKARKAAREAEAAQKEEERIKAKNDKKRGGGWKSDRGAGGAKSYPASIYIGSHVYNGTTDSCSLRIQFKPSPQHQQSNWNIMRHNYTNGPTHSFH